MGNNYKLINVRSAAILTNDWVAGSIIENASFQDKLILMIDFTKGSLTSVNIKIEFSPDNTNWYQETGSSYSSGVNTIKASVYTIDASGSLRLPPITIKDRYIKVSAQGSGTVTGSSLAIKAILGEDI